MARLSGTTRFTFVLTVAIVAIALLQTSEGRSSKPDSLREEIWWQSEHESVANPQDSIEFELSNEKCPSDLPSLEALQVETPDLYLSMFVELPGATSVAFLNPERGFVAERTGRVFEFQSGQVLAKPVIDLSDQTSVEMDQGLLGMTISPDMRWLYLNRTDLAGSSVVTAHEITSTIGERGSGIEIIVVDQPSAMHNGGDLVFGPRGHLFVSFGDGGGLGDPYGHGQNLSTPLGAILRLTVDPTNWPPHQPAPDNPDLGTGSDPRIWVNGVRNPFRFSFDEVTENLCLTDLGQQCVEEINILGLAEGGENLGWNLVEGSRPFLGVPSRSLRDPDFEYRHARGRCAIIGGLVVYGALDPILEGRYLFTDMCGGYLMALDRGASKQVFELSLRVEQPVAFARDPANNYYVVDLANGVWQLGSR